MPHTRYVEPFFGAGSVFFAKTPVAHEVINDVDGELVNFLRQLVHHRAALLDLIGQWPHARALFKLAQGEAGGTELQRAARWWRIKSGSFGGQTMHFGRQVHKPLLQSRRAIAARLDAAHRRLTAGTVSIESQDYRQVLDFYDGPEALFYFDPPYIDCADVGYTHWSLADLAELARRVKRLRGLWVLSINDRPDIRALFQDCRIVELEHLYTLAGGGSAGKRVTELLITPPQVGVKRRLKAA